MTQAAKFAAEHVSRIKITLTIDEAVKRFLESRESRSDMHYKDLNRRLNRWLATIDPANDVATVEKSEIEGYLAGYTGRNQLNHLRALSNFFRFSAKIGAIGNVPTTGMDISFRRPRVAYLESKVFADLLCKACEQNESDILAWLVLGGAAINLGVGATFGCAPDVGGDRSSMPRTAIRSRFPLEVAPWRQA